MVEFDANPSRRESGQTNGYGHDPLENPQPLSAKPNVKTHFFSATFCKT
jgi:hypothetical protein